MTDCQDLTSLFINAKSVLEDLGEKWQNTGSSVSGCLSSFHSWGLLKAHCLEPGSLANCSWAWEALLPSLLMGKLWASGCPHKLNLGNSGNRQRWGRNADRGQDVQGGRSVQLRQLPACRCGRGTSGGGSDLLNNKNKKLISFTYGLWDGHLTHNADTDGFPDWENVFFPQADEDHLSRPLVFAL